RILHVSARVTHARRDDAGDLAERGLDTPEAACSKRALLQAHLLARSTCSPIRTFEAPQLFLRFLQLFPGLFRLSLGRTRPLLGLLERCSGAREVALPAFLGRIRLGSLGGGAFLRRRRHAGEPEAGGRELLRQPPPLAQFARLGVDRCRAERRFELPERRVAVGQLPPCVEERGQGPPFALLRAPELLGLTPTHERGLAGAEMLSGGQERTHV